MFGTPFRRSAVLLAALPMALATAPAASAQDAPSCSRVIADAFGVRVAVGMGERTTVCVTDVAAGGLIVSISNETSSAITLPTVTRTTGLCPSPIATTWYPVETSVAVSDTAVCVSLNGLATTVTLGDLGYDPDPQVWRAGNGGLIDAAFCLEEYVEYQTQPWAPDRWVTCGYTPHRIL